MRKKILFSMFFICVSLISLSSCSSTNETSQRSKKEIQISFSMSMQRKDCAEAGNILTEMKKSYPKETKPFEYIDPLTSSEKSLSYNEMSSLVNKCEVNEITPDESLIFSSFVANSITDINNINNKKYDE